LGRLQELIRDLKEIAVISKACLSTFWFWLPPLFAAYFFIQLWLIFFVHPLTILILPVVLSLYSLLIEDRRIRARYGLGEIKEKKALDPLGSSPKKLTGYKWELEKAVEAYEKLLSKKEKSQD
jgi:hypothetical protein